MHYIYSYDLCKVELCVCMLRTWESVQIASYPHVTALRVIALRVEHDHPPDASGIELHIGCPATFGIVRNKMITACRATRVQSSALRQSTKCFQNATHLERRSCSTKPAQREPRSSASCSGTSLSQTHTVTGYSGRRSKRLRFILLSYRKYTRLLIITTL